MELVARFRAAVALLGRFPALAGIDLDVPRGEIVLLSGPNGAGKTTLLRACAGLVPVVAGEATVLGCDLRRDPRPVRAKVGLLAHTTGLYDDLTVVENVRFWGRAARAEPADVEAALALVGLDGRLAGVVAARLSAGQRRRAALACLLARRPELWLLDEPHAGLDRAARDQLDALMRQATRQGATVLLSSHELDRASALADRTVELVAGATRVPGSPVHAAPGPGTPETSETPGSDVAAGSSRGDGAGGGPSVPSGRGAGGDAGGAASRPGPPESEVAAGVA